MAFRLSPERPPSMGKGLLFAAASVAVTTALIYALREVAPVESTGVVYLLAVTAAATIWGMRLGIVTAVASALAWNWFHIPPTGRFTVNEGENWVALAILVGAAIFASVLADAARGRAMEAERRRREADLLRELARGLLALRGAAEARREIAEMLREALGLEAVEVVPRARGGDERRVEVPLRDGDEVAGTLLLPRDTPAETLDTLRRLAAPLAALLTATASRERLEEPILVLSAVGDEAEKVRALNAGADDDVTKPFGSDELIARLGAALRRAGRAQDEPRIVADGLEIDLAAHTVTRDGEEVHLTPTEFELLRALAVERGRLMTHATLLREVWGPAYEDDTQVLRVHIANLRKKLEAEPGRPRYIRTDQGIGYRFAA